MSTMRMPAPPPIEDLGAWLEAFTQPTVAIELAALALSAAVAWGLVRALAAAIGRDQRSVWFGRKDIDGVLFPAVLLCLVFAARAVLDRQLNVVVLQVAMPVLLALVVIRTGVKVLQLAFSQARWVRTFEQTISWLVWLALVLWVSGLLPLVLNELDQISWKVGASRLSVRNMIEGLLTASGVLIVTLWISAAIEARLLREATGGELSVRKAISNATRITLLFLGLILALSAVGIDLTALSVLGGALGVGIGFGLQKLAANYISGFLILTERSLRIGDNVRVDDFEGIITQINARYTVVRAITGREAIVPNEMLLISRVENLSLADTKVVQTSRIQVVYETDIDLAMQVLQAAAQAQPRVLQQPPASVQLSQFTTDGIELTVVYWVADIENGQGNLRSDVNLAILRALHEHGITIAATVRGAPPSPSPTALPL
jgi:small-conductance mechanosensitive channel